MPKAIEAFKQAKEFGELMEKELDSEAARTALAEALRAERRTTKVDQELVGAAADVWNSAPQQATNRGWREREDEVKFWAMNAGGHYPAKSARLCRMAVGITPNSSAGSWERLSQKV